MPELPGSRAVTVGPSGSAGALPLGGDLESAAASESQAPDPAWIASIANSLFRGLPAEGLAGPGASLPSAPVFAVDALAAQVPGTPIAAPPASPNLTPGASGIPGPGASGPAAHIHAFEPLTTQGQPTPAQAVPPSGEKGTSGPSVPAVSGLGRKRQRRPDWKSAARVCQRRRPRLAAEHAWRRHVDHSVFRRRHSQWWTRRGTAVGARQCGPATCLSAGNGALAWANFAVGSRLTPSLRSASPARQRPPHPMQVKRGRSGSRRRQPARELLFPRRGFERVHAGSAPALWLDRSIAQSRRAACATSA